MQAETAYNVIQALPESEKLRLYAMLEKDKKPVPVKTKKSNVWSVAECTEVVLKLMIARRDNRLKHNLKVA
jgi:hypothetical protein